LGFDAGLVSDNIPGVRGIGPKTAATLLADGLHLEDLPRTARLRTPRCRAVADLWDTVMTWRDMIRLDTEAPVPDDLINYATSIPLPRAADTLQELALW
jgi:DNA polymerase-1